MGIEFRDLIEPLAALVDTRRGPASNPVKELPQGLNLESGQRAFGERWLVGGPCGMRRRR